MDREQVLFRLFGKFFPEGTILYTEGSPGDEIFIVQSGAVRLGPARTGAPGGEVAGPGKILGEEAFFTHAQRRQSAVVSEESRLLQLNNKSLEALVRHSPETALLLVERFIGMAGPALQALESLSVGHLARRAEQFLLAAATRPVGAQDLAEQTGFGEAEARRLLAELERLGVLERVGESFRTPDRDLLQRTLHALAAGEKS